jgi:hypothetical protein
MHGALIKAVVHQFEIFIVTLSASEGSGFESPMRA